FALSRAMRWPQVTTLHGRLDLDELRTVYSHFNDMGLVSISNSQRQPIPSVKWLATVYHGLPSEELTPSERTSDYFAFVGRVSPEKRLDRAIEIAKAVGTKIKIAAKIDSVDQEYHERVIVPLLDHPLVEFVGEIDERTKVTFMGNAKALLFPIDWPEPFGLVMIESLACGTPVLAFRRGSVPEIIEHGVSGFVVDDMPAAIEAARSIQRLDRTKVRKAFEQRFTARRMAEDYVGVYEQVSNVQRSKR
ncbi:MAG TPA: glycosyltransferase family 4 protein, partial [Polyangiaceae bacterium]|nr:glycosyltransferase family 4 protein [Polyangiaceae bacterium]